MATRCFRARRLAVRLTGSRPITSQECLRPQSQTYRTVIPYGAFGVIRDILTPNVVRTGQSAGLADRVPMSCVFLTCCAVLDRAVVNQTWVFFIAPVTWRLDRKKPAPKHSDGFLNSSGKGVGYDHRLCESFDNGAES